MMFFFMYRGFVQYNKVQEGWSKIKSLFVIQLACVIYMLIHEFTTKSVAGYFLIVLFTTYGLFLTFSVILDSMQDKETAARRDGIHGYNFFFRVGMHTMTAVFALMSLGIKGCDPVLFPDAFVSLSVYIAFYTLFTLYLHR